MLRVTKSGSILNECGTTKMHPAGTRSIRIPEEQDPMKAMVDILNQYNALIDSRTEAVLANTNKSTADMRIGWLLWKDTLEEFLYFEEEMEKPNPDLYYAEWNVTPARGARKSSRSLWIYEKDTGKRNTRSLLQLEQKSSPTLMYLLQMTSTFIILKFRVSL